MKFGHLPSPSQVNRRINSMPNTSVYLASYGKGERYPRWWLRPSSKIDAKRVKAIASALVQYYRMSGRWPNAWVRNWRKDRTFKRALRLAKEMI